MRDEYEIVEFEKKLSVLAEHFEENDISQLCEILDDKTCNAEVMFNIIHLIETQSSEIAFKLTIESVVNIKNKAPGWSKIIIYRCLNDEYSKKMLKTVSSKLDANICKEFYDFLIIIKKEDYCKFGEAVDYVML